MTARYILRCIGYHNGVRFHISYCNSAGLSDVFRFDGVFVKAASTVITNDKVQIKIHFS